MTITEFIEARIAEDEARAAGEPPAEYRPGIALASGQWDDLEVLTINPDRVRAECEAKRQIMEIATAQIRLAREARGWDNWEAMANQTLQALASVYADHPDYNPRFVA